MATTADVPPAFQPFSPLRLLTPLLVSWKRIAVFGLCGAVAGVLVALVLPKQYTATIRFIAQSPAGPAAGTGLATLARQFGFEVDLSATGVPAPDFYVDLVFTREILEPLLTRRYVVARSQDTVDLIALLDVTGGDSRRDRIERAMRRLRSTMTVDLTRSGLTTIQVMLPDPEVAAAVANALLERLNSFTVGQLQFQSRQQRQFAEQRLQAAQGELQKAEEAEAAFLQRNQIYEQSPVLRAAYARLQRATQIKQTIVLTLARAYEEARVQEARDVPALTTVEQAVPPARKSWPPRRLIAMGGLLLGIALGIATAWLQWWLREGRQERRPEVVEFTEAWRRALRFRRR